MSIDIVASGYNLLRYITASITNSKQGLPPSGPDPITHSKRFPFESSATTEYSQGLLLNSKSAASSTEVVTVSISVISETTSFEAKPLPAKATIANALNKNFFIFLLVLMMSLAEKFNVAVATYSDNIFCIAILKTGLIYT